MTFDLPIAERKLRNTERLVHQGMWLLFLIAVGLMVIVRRSVPPRTGSVWILGCGILAFMLSFALRDVVRKLVRRNTEDKIVKDVKTFLERQPAGPIARPAPPKVELSPAPSPEYAVPSRPAGFVTLKDAAEYRTPSGYPVVFDAFPSRESVSVRTDFYAVLMPAPQNC